MNEQHDQYGYHSQQANQLWRPYAPSPFVTHQELGPVHAQIGELRQGQQSILQTYNHLRGDMITHFDKLEKLIEEARPAEQSGVNLSMRELVVIACALVLAGALLSRLPGVSNVLGG
jgi:hypothetical protein